MTFWLSECEICEWICKTLPNNFTRIFSHRHIFNCIYLVDIVFIMFLHILGAAGAQGPKGKSE